MGHRHLGQTVVPSNLKEMEEIDFDSSLSLSPSAPRSPVQSSRSSSMIFKKPNSIILAHLVAEAISSLNGLDLRWSGPITLQEMQYVERYIYAKYPQYCDGLVQEAGDIDLYSLRINDESSEIRPDDKGRSPRNGGTRESSSPPFSRSLSDVDKSQLEPSKLLDILARKSSFSGNFVSIPEIQAEYRALRNCGLREGEYLVVFLANCKDAMMMIGASYPFFKGNTYMSIISEDCDHIKELAAKKDSRVIIAPEAWLDLRIQGSKLSQYFRKKCKHICKGLFAYPAYGNETKYSMHWISEAHRNPWHVLLDTTGIDFEKNKLSLALHRPNFVLCTLNNTHPQPSKIACLLVRRNSFETTNWSIVPARFIVRVCFRCISLENQSCMLYLCLL